MTSVFLDFIQRRSLSVWATTGWDGEYGSSYEALDASGAPLRSLPKRTRVQLRQIYSYAKAHAAGLCDSTQIIDELLEFLQKDALSDSQGGCAHLLQRDGRVVDKTRDLYDQAFLLLACASSYKAIGRQQYLALAHATQDYLDQYLKAENGGWYESDQSVGEAAVMRRQNPHMHLFEAYLALYDATGDPVWRTLADEIFDLFERVFYDPAAEVLLEYFEPDWTPVANAQQKIEPGHMLEWSWLLDEYRRLTGQNTRVIRQHLLSRAVEIGLNKQTGLIYDSLNSALEVNEATHRLWPQTEYIKALVIAAEHEEEGAESALDDAVRAFVANFVSKTNNQIWIDKVDALGKALNEKAPASSFYHAICAAGEYARLNSADTVTPATIATPKASPVKLVIANTG